MAMELFNVPGRMFIIYCELIFTVFHVVRHPALDTQLTKDRHKAEARSLLKCKQIGVRVPTMFLCDNTQFIIVMQNLSQATTAKDSINKLLAENNRDELVKLAKMVGSVVAKMHQSGLIHGDLTSSNILVENTAESAYQLAMIDFGLSSLVGYIQAVLSLVELPH